MNETSENSYLSFESQKGHELFTARDSTYQKHLYLEMGARSIFKGLMIRKEPAQKKHIFQICKYPELLKHSLQIGDKNKYGRKERFINLKELQTVRAAELSLNRDFDKWKTEGKHKSLFTAAESLKIARIFIAEESSLEMLLMLADIGSQSIEELGNAFPPKDKTIKVLFDLWEYDVISVKENTVIITHRGNELVSKLRKKSQEI
ncbi:MAG: hypothetical protein Q8M95_02005 [Candidatus Methanoperedens sp.]|nr:hypothetical protein [Candidatus Methanoperedens sp.]